MYSFFSRIFGTSIESSQQKVSSPIQSDESDIPLDKVDEETAHSTALLNIQEVLRELDVLSRQWVEDASPPDLKELESE
jgi:hypothetical protein